MSYNIKTLKGQSDERNLQTMHRACATARRIEELALRAVAVSRVLYLYRRLHLPAALCTHASAMRT